jgi:hypothetical protein
MNINQNAPAGAILNAYNCVMDPMSNFEARNQATVFLEEVKKNPVACRNGAIELLQQPNPQARRKRSSSLFFPFFFLSSF